MCGDALGNATPLGPLVSEPAKVAFVRDRVPLGVAFTALAIENLFYTLSVAAVIAAGTIALLLRGGLSANCCSRPSSGSCWCWRCMRWRRGRCSAGLR